MRGYELSGEPTKSQLVREGTYPGGEKADPEGENGRRGAMTKQDDLVEGLQREGLGDRRGEP